MKLMFASDIHAFNIQGIIPNNEAIVSIALEKYGASTALIMAFGMPCAPRVCGDDPGASTTSSRQTRCSPRMRG